MLLISRRFIVYLGTKELTVKHDTLITFTGKNDQQLPSTHQPCHNASQKIYNNKTSD